MRTYQIAAAFLLCCCGTAATLPEHPSSLTRLVSQFENPSAEFRGKPFWAWNGNLTKEEIVRQVPIFKQMGFGGFFMHSRTGLGTEYLGDKWFEMVNAASNAAGKEGLQAWLYDEDRWPSGIAGGLVTRNPQFRMKFLSLHTMPMAQFKWQRDLVAAFACDLQGTVVSECSRLSASSVPDSNKTALIFTVEEMKSAPDYNGYTNADTMNRDATDEFIHLTHDEYKKHSGDEFGKVIKGIFSDEPQRGPVFNGFSITNANYHQMAPWTDALPGQFQKRFGYDLRDKLPELFFYLNGELVSPVKWQYMEQLQTMFLDNWEKPIHDWCVRNHLIFTGHVLHEDSLTAQAAPQGSLMRYYEYEDYPGVDVLSEGNRNYWLAKQVASVSHQLNKPRTLSELYGATGWQFTFGGHKYVGDWQEIFGINFRVQHLSWYTMAGEAKRDYPSSIFFQSAWWKDYKYVEDYYARLNVLLTQGQPVRDVLVLSPIESVWAQVGVGWAEGLSPNLKSIQDLETAYETLFHWFTERHVDFDYADEDMMRRLSSVGKDANGPYLQLGVARYRAVVVPQMTTIRSSSLELLSEFRQLGGRLVFAGEAPAYVDAVHSPAAAALAAASTRTAWDGDAVVSSVREAVSMPVRITKPEGSTANDLFYQLRVDGGRRIFAVMSMDREHWNRGIKLAIKTNGFVAEWDCRTGERHQITADNTNGWLSWNDDFAPLGEHVYLVTPAAEPVPVKPVLREVSSTPVKGPFSYSLSEPNVVVLDLARYRIGAGDWMPETEVLKIDHAVRQQFGLPFRAGDEIQPWFKKKFQAPPQAKGPVSMEFSFSIDKLPETPVRLAMEQPENYQVAVNGKTVQADGRWWVDPAIRTIPIPADVLKLGGNIVTITTDFRDDVDIESLYLIGEFGVRVDDSRKVITHLPTTLAAGDLVNQGLPFYSGAVIYHVPISESVKRAEKLFVQTPKFEGACVKVEASGSDPRMIAWEPYQAEVPTAAVRNGTVDVEVVLTRRNTFGPLHLVPKEAPAYGPDSFRTEGAAWSQDYQLYASGLLADPRIAVYRIK